MRTFILDIIPKIKRYSESLDKLTVLTNKHWVVIDDELNKKVVFIFREKDNQLLISDNGRIEKGNWEYLGHNSLLIDRSDGSYLFKHGFIDNYVLALKVDGKEEYALLVNEDKFDDKLNSLPSVIEMLNKRYIEQKKENLITIPESNLISQSNNIYPRIEIKELDSTQIFSPSKYDLDDEIRLIRRKLGTSRYDHVSNIVISFAKNHSIKSIWAEKNPEVANLVVNKKVPIGALARLFEENKGNDKFITDLEEYLTKTLTIDGEKYLSQGIYTKEFAISDYPRVRDQITNCLSHLNGSEAKLFCEILLKHLKGFNISNDTSANPRLISMIKKPLVALDAIHSLYSENYMDKLFLEDYEFYLRQRMR